MGFLRRHPILLSIILLILAIQVFSLYINDKQVGNPFSRFILSLNYYPQKLINSATGRIVNVWGNYIYLIDTKKENLKLQLENKKLRQKTVELLEAELQNERLRKLLQFKESTTHDTVTANVIGGSPSLLRKEVVIIDKGAKSGITEGMPVASYDGIVGRIHLVGNRNSEVLLITDPLSAVDAYIHRTRARGIVKGTGNGCVMDYIENNTDLSRGDKVISSGKDGYFPKGVLIGTVDDIEAKEGFLSAHVSPNVELNSLEEVLVILKTPESIAFNE